MTLAILCSGQGRQSPEMFELIAEVPAAAALFVCATGLLGGRDPRDIVRRGSDEVLFRNRVGQILCSVQALAVATALRDVFPRELIIAGYSVGEVAAWGVAGFLSMSDTLGLVARRADIMDAASEPSAESINGVRTPGDGLMFVRGLTRELIEKLCIRLDASIAIVNPGDAYVVGGPRVALEAFAREAKEEGATRVADIRVNVASHTRRLAKAAVEFREVLRGMSAEIPPGNGVRLLSGIDGTSVIDSESGFDKLAAQISTTVQWAACLDSAVESGASAFLELGPGRALTQMLTGGYRDIPARSVDDFKTLDGLRAWVSRHVRL